jgi:NAD(P)H-hydrate epimerase
MRYVTREEMQELDRKAQEEFGIPGIILMENAGRSVAIEVANICKKSDKILIICGKGNNGGDGFVCARHLYNKAFNIKVALLGKVKNLIGKGDAGANLNIIVKMGLCIIEIDDLSLLAKEITNCDLIIDAIFGTGPAGEIKGLEKEIIEEINRSGKYIVSIDIPSGLSANLGIPLGVSVRAKKTITMGLPKIGFVKNQARDYTGKVIVADIGMPKELLV